MKKAKKVTTETDNAYFLKILLYFVLGTIWLQYDGYTVIPIGLILGVMFAHHDHFSIDRKVEYAILIIAALMGLAGYGLFIKLPYLAF